MELRHVVAFVTVAEELHFGRAADRLGIAQPAVSRLVRRLEADLDVTLFERTSQRVSLTAVGAQLLDHAQTIVAEHARLVAAATALGRGEGGLLRLGTTEAMSAQLDILLERFATLKPTVRVELHPAHTPRKLELLASGELDLAIVREAQPTPGPRIEPLWSDPLVAVLPASHPHAMTAPLDRVRLDLPLLLIARDTSPGVHDAVRAAAGAPERSYRFAANRRPSP